MVNHSFLYTETKLVFKCFERYLYNMVVLERMVFDTVIVVRYLQERNSAFFKAINVTLTMVGKAVRNDSMMGIRKTTKGKGVRVAIVAVRGNSPDGKACLGGLASKLRPCKLARTIKKSEGGG